MVFIKSIYDKKPVTSRHLNRLGVFRLIGRRRPKAARRSPRKADIPGGSTQRPGRYNRKRLQPIQRAGDMPRYL